MWTEHMFGNTIYMAARRFPFNFAAAFGEGKMGGAPGPSCVSRGTKTYAVPVGPAYLRQSQLGGEALSLHGRPGLGTGLVGGLANCCGLLGHKMTVFADNLWSYGEPAPLVRRYDDGGRKASIRLDGPLN